MTVTKQGQQSAEDRVRAALRREGESSASAIGRTIGIPNATANAALTRGVQQGWCRFVRMDGQSKIYALVPGGERAG